MRQRETWPETNRGWDAGLAGIWSAEIYRSVDMRPCILLYSAFDKKFPSVFIHITFSKKLISSNVGFVLRQQTRLKLYAFHLQCVDVEEKGGMDAEKDEKLMAKKILETNRKAVEGDLSEKSLNLREKRRNAGEPKEDETNVSNCNQAYLLQAKSNTN